MIEEIYEAVARGQLDALSFVDGFIVPYKIHEMVKYVSFDMGAILGQGLAVNLDVWNSLSPEQQRAFQDPDFQRKTTEQFNSIWQSRRDADWKIMADSGITFIDVDPAEQQRCFSREESGYR